MAGFAPQLNAGVGFVQAQQGSAGGLGVLSSLSGMLPSGSKPAGRAPSEDERNAALWQDMYPDQDIASASMGQLRKFGKRNPSAAEWGVSTAEGVLNQNVADFEAATESERTISTKLREDWATSPDGVVAQNTAASIEDEGRRATYLAEQHASWMGRQVKAQLLTEETQQYGVNAKRRDEMWTLEGFNMKGGADTVATAMTDAVESMMLNPSATLNLDDTGITAAIPQLAGTVLTRDNAPMVMETFRSAYIDNQTRRVAGAYGVTAGELGQMPDDVKNQVFGKFDSTLTWLTKEVDPAQIKKRLDNEAYLGMIEAGVPLDKINAISLAAKGNPELTAAITASLVGDVGAVMQGFENGDFDGALQTANNLSKQERDRSFAGFSELAKVWGGTSSAGEVYAEVPEAMKGVGFATATMSAFTVAQAESGDTPLVLGKNWYKQNVESQGQAYVLAAKHYPNFEPTMVKNLTSDLATNVEMLRTEASKQGFVPKLENGNIVLVHGGPTHTQKMAAFEAAIASAKEKDPASVGGIEANREAYLAETPTAMNLEIGDKSVDVLGDAVYKFNALKNLGDIGSQVRDLTTADFNLVDAEADAIAAKTMATFKDQAIIDAGGIITTELGSAETAPTTPEAPVANGRIAEAVGVDFGSIEQEYGLPEGYLERTAQIESSGNPDAKNPNSSAGGLFQQIDSNAKEFGVTDRFNPEQSTVGAAKFAKQNAAKLRGVLGREPTGAELYLAHQQGGAGAARLLSDRDRPVNTLLSDDAITLNGGSLDMTAGDFADLWIDKWNATSGGRATNAAQATPPSSSPAQLADNQPEATTSLGVQPSAPASEAGAFVQTPTGEGENLGTDRTGGEAFKAAAARQDSAVDEGVADNLRAIASNASALHGKGSATTKKINALIKTVDGGGKVKASDVTKLIKETKALPRTPSRQELLADLYEMRDEANG
jgi:hypothetical protein